MTRSTPNSLTNNLPKTELKKHSSKILYKYDRFFFLTRINFLDGCYILGSGAIFEKLSKYLIEIHSREQAVRFCSVGLYLLDKLHIISRVNGN